MRRHAGGIGCGARARAPARHAPGRRRGSAWWPIGAARQELADGGRPVFHGRPRKARPGAVRKTPQMSPDCASLSGWRAERRPVFPRGNTGTQEQWLRPLARHPPHFLRGEEENYGVPGAAKKQGGGVLAKAV